MVFIEFLTPEHIRALGRIELVIHDDRTCSWDDDPDVLNDWSWSFGPDRISQLRGLSYLHLDLSISFLCHVALSDTAKMWDDEDILWDALKKFRDLPLKQLIVDSSEEVGDRNVCGRGVKLDLNLVKQGIKYVRRTLLTE